MRLKQKGFAIIELLAILIVLGILVFAGRYIYQNRKTGDKVYKSQPNSGAVLETPNGKNVTVKKITIKELGIAFNVPVTLKNLTYKVFNNDDMSLTAYLSTKELDSAESGICNISNAVKGNTAPLGYITKTPGQYPGDINAVVQNGNFAKQFSSFYVTYAHSQSCFNMSSNNENAVNLSGQLSAALKSMTEVKN
jgi:type II secretory pathway pseudopilin PulG